MDIAVIGLNHKSAPVEIRERLAIPGHKIDQAFNALRTLLDECVILSTCNRVEIYTISSNNCVDGLKNFLSTFNREDLSLFNNNIYTYFNEECVRHLFKVACGLDSMVLGENEILGQVKNAYLLAHQKNFTGKIFNILFQKSLAVGKKVRTCTEINKGSVSVGSVSVDLARRIFGNLSDRKVIIIGAGKVSELTLKYLVKKGVSSVIVSNRTFERARKLAETFKGKAVTFDDLPHYLGTADIVISSTSAPHYIIRKEVVLSIMPQRRQKSLFFVDLGVPRNVEPEINRIDNVFLYDIDDLNGIVKENQRRREQDIKKCNTIIEKKVKWFMEQFRLWKSL